MKETGHIARFPSFIPHLRGFALFFRNGFLGAGACAATAADAFIGVDCELVSVLGNRGHGASGGTFATTDADVLINYVCHNEISFV